MNATAVEIPARKGKAAHVARGQYIQVINTHGEQVVDTWAFNRDELGEFMSMEHTRAHTLRLVPRVGEFFAPIDGVQSLALSRTHPAGCTIP